MPRLDIPHGFLKPVVYIPDVRLDYMREIVGLGTMSETTDARCW